MYSIIAPKGVLLSSKTSIELHHQSPIARIKALAWGFDKVSHKR